MSYTAESFTEFRQTKIRLTAGNQAMEILQSQGANWCSWVVDGVNLMPDPVVQPGRPPMVLGSPVLFPTPNRIWNAAYRYKGKVVHQRLNGRPHILHGLVGYAPFTLEAMGNTDNTAYAVLSYAITGGEALESYPWPCKLTLTYTLDDKGPEIAYKVENLGTEEMPYGFAIHPYFNTLGDKKDVNIQVPAPSVHISSPDHFPTGEVIPVEGTKWDLRKPVTVETCTNNDIDDVFFGMDSGKTAVIRWEKAGHKVTLNATDDFTHMVVYTPPMPVFCLENQTCSTDFINRHEAGFTETAHLMTLQGGESHEGRIKFVHEGI